MFEEIYKINNHKVYLLGTKNNSYQIMLKDELNITAIYYVSKDGCVFGFFPIDYTYGNMAYYDEIVQAAIKVLLGKEE